MKRRKLLSGLAALAAYATLGDIFAENAEAAAPPRRRRPKKVEPSPRADISFKLGEPDSPIIADEHANDVIYPASLTKLMTALILFEQLRAGNIRLTDKIEITQRSKLGTTGQHSSGIKAGTQITVEHALLLMMTRSHNDVAYSIAQHISGHPSQQAKYITYGLEPGSEEAFIRLFMQPKAGELGMKNTRFVNSHGLPPDETDIKIIGNMEDYFNISTAADMAKLWNHLLMEYPEYRQYLGAPEVFNPGYGRRGRTEASSNFMLENAQGSSATPCPGVLAGKTGLSDRGRASALLVCRPDPETGEMMEFGTLTFGHKNAVTRDRHARNIIERTYENITRLLSRINSPALHEPRAGL